MRRFPDPQTPFRVVISPTGWRVVGSLAFDDFRSVCRALDAVAFSVAQRRPTEKVGDAGAPSPDEELTLEVSGYRVTYTLDLAQRTVTLLDITRPV